MPFVVNAAMETSPASPTQQKRAHTRRALGAKNICELDLTASPVEWRKVQFGGAEVDESSVAPTLAAAKHKHT